MELEAVFPFSAMPAEWVAGVCVQLLRQLDVIGDLLFYGEAVAEEALCRSVRSRQHFVFDVERYRMRWSGVANFDLALLLASGLPTDSAQRVCLRLGGQMPLVVARLYDKDYHHWQNAFDPLQFRTGGRSMDGLPMKSNGLPYPLQQQIVDTSQNPGRRVLRDGYVEAIGHRMWLGPEYFTRVPRADRDAIVNADWLQVTELENSILEIIASDEPFTDGSTDDRQNRLRRLLFPTTA